jgi:hypothetical protein
MLQKKRARHAPSSSSSPFSIEPLEPRKMLSVSVDPVQLATPYPHAPVAPWMQLNGSGADPADEMTEATAISTGGASAGDIAVLTVVPPEPHDHLPSHIFMLQLHL